MIRAAGTLADEVLETEPHIHRLSVADVRRMYDTGVLGESDRVELLDGVLYDVSPASERHSHTIAWLNRRLVTASSAVDVRVQMELAVHGGFVVPDLLVADPVPERDRPPERLHLAVEVAVTSQPHDHAKAWRYARARVAALWIVDLPARTVFVHEAPRGDHFATIARLGDGDLLTLPFGEGTVDVTELLGPAA